MGALSLAIAGRAWALEMFWWLRYVAYLLSGLFFVPVTTSLLAWLDSGSRTPQEDTVAIVMLIGYVASVTFVAPFLRMDIADAKPQPLALVADVAAKFATVLAFVYGSFWVAVGTPLGAYALLVR